MGDAFEKDIEGWPLSCMCSRYQDFAMAYSCEYQNEIQWSWQSVNLFTAAMYSTVYDPGGSSQLVIVMDSTDKCKGSVFVFVKALTRNIIIFCEGEELVILYILMVLLVNLKINSLAGKFLSVLSLELQVPVTWKYFATSHGKGGEWYWQCCWSEGMRKSEK